MMMRLKHWSWQVLCFGAILLAPSLSLADDTRGQSITRITPNGYFNWTTGTATATGLGVPPQQAASPAQAKEMTRAAAWSVALANLLEVVNGIRVDAHTTVKNYVTTNAEVQTHVEGMVKQATVIDEQELPTGEVKTTVQMHIAGALTEHLATAGSTPQAKLPRPALPTQPGGKTQSQPTRPAPPAKSATKGQTVHTGLVIDARGIGAQQALAPRIVALDDEIYGPSIVERSLTTSSSVPPEEQKRIAWYFTDEATARSHQKVAPNPFIIRALGVIAPSKTDLIIEETKAQRLQSLPEYRDFLKQAKVVIVIDPE